MILNVMENLSSYLYIFYYYHIKVLLQLTSTNNTKKTYLFRFLTDSVILLHKLITEDLDHQK